MSETNTRESRLQTFVENYYTSQFSNKKINILEAGCGAETPIRFDWDSWNKHIVGIDISSKQLERNKLIDERIVGDIQTFPLKQSEYDLIICWNVLEHLPNPELALKNFANAIKPGGLVIIGVPNVLSLKGLITKFTPLGFHTFYYKYIVRSTYADGTEDKGPFKTYLRKTISLPSMKQFINQNNLKIMYKDTSDIEDLQHTNKMAFSLYVLARGILKLLSFGRLGDSELTVVFSKN